MFYTNITLIPFIICPHNLRNLPPQLVQIFVLLIFQDESHKEDQSDAEDSPGRPQSREENNVSTDSESEKPKKVCSVEPSDDEAGSDKENHFTNEDNGGEREENHDQINDTDSEKDARASPEHHESRGGSENDSPAPLRSSNSDDEQEENEKTGTCCYCLNKC